MAELDHNRDWKTIKSLQTFSQKLERNQVRLNQQPQCQAHKKHSHSSTSCLYFRLNGVSTFRASHKNKDGDERGVQSTKTAAVYENLQLCRGSLRLARRADWSLAVMWTAGMGTYFP